MSGGELEPFGVDSDAELGWLVGPRTPAPSPAELARQAVRHGLPLVVDGLVRLALTAESEKIRFEASRFVVQLAGLLGVAEVSAPGLDNLMRELVDPGSAAA